HTLIGLAALHDHRLWFPLYFQAWGGGVASVQPHHGETVWGVLYDVGDADMKALDGYEGFHAPGDQHNVFERESYNVELVRPDDGSFPRRVRASLYVAHPSNPSPPSARYRDQMLKGAKASRLPEEYIARIAAVPVGAETTEATET